MYANASQTLSLHNTDSECGKFCRFHFMQNGYKSLKGFQLCPWTRLGAEPPDPRYRLALLAFLALAVHPCLIGLYLKH